MQKCTNFYQILILSEPIDANISNFYMIGYTADSRTFSVLNVFLTKFIP